MIQQRISTRGSTLIELLVSIGIASSVLAIAATTSISAITFHQKYLQAAHDSADIELARSGISNELEATPMLRELESRSIWRESNTPDGNDIRAQIFSELSRRYPKLPGSIVLALYRYQTEYPAQNSPQRLCFSLPPPSETPRIVTLFSASGVSFRAIPNDNCLPQPSVEHERFLGALLVKRVTFVYLDTSQTLRRLRYPERQNHPLTYHIDDFSSVVDGAAQKLLIRRKKDGVEVPIRLGPEPGSALDYWY